MSRPHRALVTGATGFVGSNLVRALAHSGWQVHAVVRPESRTDVLGGNATIHRHDGTTDQLSRIVTLAAPDVAFHLASLFISEHKPHDVTALVDCNIRFPAQLLEALRHAGVGRLVNTGTSWQHFENRDHAPVNFYAATKQAFESLLDYYVDAHGLRAVTLLLFDTYGPGDPRAKLLSLVHRAAKTNTALPLSPGEQLMDLVHIEDVVAAFIIAAHRLLDERSPGHERYTVSSGAPLSLRELVERYAQALEKPVPVRWGDRAYRAREVMRPWNRGTPLPGWQPRIGLEQGLLDLVRSR